MLPNRVFTLALASLLFVDASDAQLASLENAPEAVLAELAPNWFFSDGLEFVMPSALIRTTSLKIRDPHFFAPVFPPFVCPDFTDNDLAGQPNSAVNNQINLTLTTDSDTDGFLDSSSLWIFQNALAGPQIRRFDTAGGQCSAPLASTTCSFPAATTADTYTVISSGADTCFSPIAATTGGYTPSVASVSAAWLIVVQSDDDPMIMPTIGSFKARLPPKSGSAGD